MTIPAIRDALVNTIVLCDKLSKSPVASDMDAILEEHTQQIDQALEMIDGLEGSLNAYVAQIEAVLQNIPVPDCRPISPTKLFAVR